MAKVSLRNYNREIETMVDRNQLDEAIAHCQHILKTFPKHLETYRLLGKAYLEYKRYNEAVDIFSRVLAAEPNDFVANVGMSIIRDEQNKLDDAIWHMERAFETQPSNPAIQSELQRLYARRDGIQPPRIRMTRGALAHMYVQGELYPQAISEIKSVLKEDQGRSDMSVLLARAYFKSGQKNEAAEAANSVLRRYPYCLDANRVLVEILGADRPENAQIYRQRVVELDPYASQVSGSIFQSNEVGDNAVTLEHLDWNGQPVGMQSDWGSTKALPATSGSAGSSSGEPDWLKMGLADSTPQTPPPSQPKAAPSLPTSSPSIDFSSPSNAPQPTPKTVPTSDEIPEFLRAAGWGESTGEFDESKSSAVDEPATPTAGASLEQGDLPEWVKAMMPQQAAQPEQPAQPTQPPQEEELPDWIQNIGTGALSAAKTSNEQPDWLKDTAESTTAQSVPTADQPDWLKGLDQPAQPTAPSDQPDWLKGMEQPAQPAAQSEQPDWMQGLSQPATTSNDDVDWLKSLDQTQPSQPAAADDSMDWLKGLDQPTQAQPTATAPSDEVDWLKSLDQTQPSQPAATADASMDWLKGLDQPATAEADLDWLKPTESTQPAQPVASDDQPDWMKGFDQPTAQPTPQADQPDWLRGMEQPAQASVQSDELDWLKGLGEESETTSAAVSNEFDFLAETPQPTPPSTPVVSTTDTANLGTSEQERDDSFAWLEALAAKQGASEGLLTKPEERKQEEPDWVKQAKGMPTEQPTQQPVASEPAPVTAEVPISATSTPTAKSEDLGKSEQERDDSFAWLEALAAKQGASEGLLTKPEDRLQEEPEWVKQAKGSTETPAQSPVVPTPVEAVPTSNVQDLGKSQQDIDASLAWLENLAAKQGATEGLLTKPEERLQEEPDWVKQVKSTPQAPVEPTPVQPPVQETPAEPISVAKAEDLGKSDQERDDSFAWLEALAAKQGASEGLLTKPEERLHEEPEWVKQAKATPQAPVQQAEISQQPTPDEAAPSEASSQSTPVEIPSQSLPAESAPVAKAEDLGRSDQERDDSFAWLEALAAKQGASEGLLTKPEERLQEEPEWVKQAKSAPQIPAEPILPTQPESVVEKPASTAEDTTAWLRSLQQEETIAEPESSADETAMWFKNLEEPAEAEAAQASQPEPADDLPAWLQGLEEEKPAEEPTSRKDETMMWFKGLEKTTPIPAAPAPQAQADEDVPAWLRGIEEEEKLAETESAIPAQEASDEFDWLNDIEEPSTTAEVVPAAKEENLPSWLKGIDEESSRVPDTVTGSLLPAWMRDETGEVLAEPTKIEPTRSSDWRPAEQQPELQAPQPIVQEQPSTPEPEPIMSQPVAPEPVISQPVSAQPVKSEKPARKKPAEPKPEPYREPVTSIRGTGMLTMPTDPILGGARNELSRSNIPGALEAYEKLIKKGRYLDEVIFDLRGALDRYPVEVSILQALGDAYMRANRLQDALDAYTKAEELLR